jgi:intraflagellar transport protein 140
MMRYALKTTHPLMLECAQHFEKKGELEKAIQLYHRGGDLPKALDLCFRAGEEGKAAPNKREAQHKNAAVFEMLNNIAADLGSHSNPATLAKCADFLVQHKQFDRAVELYVMAGKFIQAVEMCLENRVTISEAMVETLTPPPDMPEAERKSLLADVGKALKLQGSYTLASKKYVQAGDRVRAIKCLVRAGDTKAVMQFANISRNPEIYKLAANYLQQMNWRESVEIMKAIIMFYTKSKSFEQLAGFYDSCAQVEIDDYRDYEKATGALREGTKHLLKSETRSAADMLARFEQRIVIIEKFVQARRLATKDPESMVSMCESLLQRAAAGGRDSRRRLPGPHGGALPWHRQDEGGLRVHQGVRESQYRPATVCQRRHA